MKSSTLHRSGLTKEKMSLIENVKPQTFNNSRYADHSSKAQKKPELDVLWRDFDKSFHTKTKAKTPIVYVGGGFVLGVIVASIISIIVFASTYPEIKEQEFTNEKNIQIETQSTKAPDSISPLSTGVEEKAEVQGLEEKYTVKAGDTLDKIAYRFYGKYDPDKIKRIMQINNIKNETRIQIGQVLIIPLD